MTMQFNWRMRLFALAAALLVQSEAAIADDTVGAAEKLRGKAHIGRRGADYPIAVGTLLELHDRVQTAARARLKIAFRDGSTLTLAENTAIEITHYAVSTGGGSRNVMLTVISGLVNVVASKSGEANFNYQVRTANAYSAVRGTNWVVAALPTGSTFYIIDGLVEVGTGGGSRVVVDNGKSVTVNAQGSMSAVQPIPPDLMKQVLDATDVASANATPEAAPTTTTTTTPEETPANPTTTSTSAAPTQTRQKSDGGGGGHGM